MTVIIDTPTPEELAEILRWGVKEDVAHVVIIESPDGIWAYAPTCLRGQLREWLIDDQGVDIDDLHPTVSIAYGEIDPGGNLVIGGNSEVLKDLVPLAYVIWCREREELFSLDFASTVVDQRC